MKSSMQSLPMLFWEEATPKPRAAVERAVAVAPPLTSLPVRPARARAGGCSTSLRVVGILAFGQSLLFLLLWLFLCARAGAASKPAPGFNPELRVSSYQPATERDPFLPAGNNQPEVKIAAETPLAFDLQGILFDPANPSAIINDRLIALNKTLTLEIGKINVEVKAVEITRERVVLQVAGKRVELQLNSTAPPKPAKP